MKRLLHGVVDLAIGCFLGYFAGLLVYMALLAVMLGLTHQTSRSQSTSFMIGMLVVPPLVVVWNVWRGQRKLTRQAAEAAAAAASRPNLAQ